MRERRSGREAAACRDSRTPAGRSRPQSRRRSRRQRACPSAAADRRRGRRLRRRSTERASCRQALDRPAPRLSSGTSRAQMTRAMTAQRVESFMASESIVQARTGPGVLGIDAGHARTGSWVSPTCSPLHRAFAVSRPRTAPQAALDRFDARQVLLRLLVAGVGGQRVRVCRGRRLEAPGVLERHAEVVVERRARPCAAPRPWQSSGSASSARCVSRNSSPRLFMRPCVELVQLDRAPIRLDRPRPSSPARGRCGRAAASPRATPGSISAARVSLAIASSCRFCSMKTRLEFTRLFT